MGAVLGALVRVLGSSTWWSAVLSIVASIVCKSNGVELPVEVLAAAPLAVGLKEAGKHLATSQVGARVVGAIAPTTGATTVAAPAETSRFARTLP